MYKELYHYGVKGMKWGVRKTNRIAAKDAKEYARAKMYYGEGAGNRRKLIKAQVESRSKNVPGYKEAFDKALASQDMAGHAVKAKRERRIKTGAKKTTKTVRGVINSALYNGARVSAASATIYAVAKYTGADKKIMKYGSTAMNKVNNYVANRGLRKVAKNMNKLGRIVG